MSDADWAVRHSTSGFVFSMSKAAISWGSKKQPTIALSSCESEIMAASEAAKSRMTSRRLGHEGEVAPWHVVSTQSSLNERISPRDNIPKLMRQ